MLLAQHSLHDYRHHTRHHYHRYCRAGLIILLMTLAHTVWAQRIISTDALATELLFALDAGQDLIAADVTSQLPASHAHLPSIGYHRNLSAEGLLALKPDLIVGSEWMGPPTVIELLSSSGINLLQLSAALDIATLVGNIETLGSALNRPTQAQKLIQEITQRAQQLQAQPLLPPTTIFLLALNPGKLRVAGQHTQGNALIQLIGGNNPVHFSDYRDISVEALLALSPQVILLSGRQQAGLVEAVLAQHPLLKQTPAGRQQRIFSVNGRSLIAGLSPAALDEAHRIQTRLLAPVQP